MRSAALRREIPDEPIEIAFKARPYQQEAIDWFRKGGKKAACIWHRKAGKDRVATFIESELAFQRPGLYWHALPQYADARKVVWDAIMPDGKRLIHWAFPTEVCKYQDHEMKVTLPNGSIWQPVGADNYDSLVGAFPVHVTWSEFALMNPQARNFIRPALAMSGGSELIITTTRGYNHAFDIFEYAKRSKDWFASIKTVADTRVLTEEILDEERRTMPDELYRQEYECDWAAANVGAILGRYVEDADKSGRILDEGERVEYDEDGAGIEISSDLGRRHVSAFWFWQPRLDGYALLDYDEEAGLDPEEWIERLQAKLKGKRLTKIWLPHDARAKTFAAKHSAVEYFIRGFGSENVAIVPRSSVKSHSITAGQVVLRKCWFNARTCKQGLAALRSWAYRYDEVRRQYSKEPVDDWAADGADAFCEGAKVMRERVIDTPKPTPNQIVKRMVSHKMTLDALYEEEESLKGLERRI